MYAPIHKVQRHMLATALGALGCLEPNDDAAAAEAIRGAREAIAIVEDHTDHEHRYAHPLIARVDLALVDELEREHAGFAAERADVFASLARLEAATPSTRGEAAYECYLAFSLFAGRYFVHLHEEETRAQPALAAAASDEELRTTEAAIMRLVPWEQTRTFVARALPVMAPADRAGFLSALHAAFPRETGEARPESPG